MKRRCAALLALIVLLYGANALAETPVLLDRLDSFRQTVCELLAEEDLPDAEWFWARGDEQAQRRQMADVLERSPGVILLNPVSPDSVGKLLEMAAAHDVPVVLFNREPTDMSVLTAYGDRVCYVGSQTEQAGEMQGRAIAQMLSEHPEYDRNGDGKIQYVMLMGEADNRDAQARTSGCLDALASLGVAMEPVIPVQVCDWDDWEAQKVIQHLLIDQTAFEMVISNNDAMAVGALAALNAFGVNLVGGKDYIPVVGVDATDDAVDLIQSGMMTATVRQDAKGMAKAIAEIALAMRDEGLTAQEAIVRAGYEPDGDAPVVRFDYQPYNE